MSPSAIEVLADTCVPHPSDVERFDYFPVGLLGMSRKNSSHVRYNGLQAENRTFLSVTACARLNGYLNTAHSALGNFCRKTTGAGILC